MAVSELLGKRYELALLHHILIQGLDDDFDIGHEIKFADKFDDIVIRFKIEKQFYYILSQLKHIDSSQTRINKQDLLSQKNEAFALQKYFLSYLRILNQLSDNNEIVQNLVIYTNCDLGDDVLKIVSENDIKLLSLMDTNESGKTFQLEYDEDYREIWSRTPCDFELLINALYHQINLTAKEKLPSNEYQCIVYFLPVLISSKIFDKRENTFRFHKNFVKSERLSNEVQEIRNELQMKFQENFEEALKQFQIKITQNQKELDKHIPFIVEEIKELIKKQCSIPYIQFYHRELSDHKILSKDKEDQTTIIYRFHNNFVVKENKLSGVQNFLREQFGQENRLKDIRIVIPKCEKVQKNLPKRFGNLQQHFVDFLNLLRFKVNQGNISDLHNLRTREIDRKCLHKYYEKLQMIIPQFSNHEIWVSHLDKEKFLQQYVNLANFTLLENESETLCENLQKYDIKFTKNGFNENLQNSGVYRIVTNDTFLTSMKIVSFRSKTVTNPNIYLKINNTNCKQLFAKLLLVKNMIGDLYLICDNQLECNFWDDIFNVLNKIVVITSEDFYINSEKEIQILTDNAINLSDLEDYSNILSRTVKFQGNEVLLGEVIQKPLPNTNDYKILSAILQNNKPIILDSFDTNAVKIERSFNVPVLKDSILYKADGLDLFLNSQHEFIHHQTSHKIYNIHLYCEQNSKLVWKNIFNDLSGIKNYRDFTTTIQTSNKVFLESDTSKVILITAPSGMGKSIEMFNLFRVFKSAHPNFWILKINLNEHISFFNSFKKQNEKLLKEEAIHFVTETVPTTSTYIKSYIRQAINEIGNIILLFDGLDEIFTEYINVTLEIIKHLRDTKIAKIILATRPNIVEVIEESLNIFSYSLTELNSDQQEDFLIQIFNDKFQEEKTENQLKIRQYSKSILELYHGTDETFTSFPLHLELLSEIFFRSTENWEGCYEFVYSEENEVKLSNNLDLISVYKEVIDRKFQIRLQKKLQINIDLPALKSYYNQMYSSFLDVYNNFSFLAVFDEDMLTEFHSKKELFAMKEKFDQFKGSLEDVGIIEKFVGDRPQFTHRSFAEYFLAKNLIIFLNQETQSKYITQVLLSTIFLLPIWSGVRKFLNCLLENYKMQINTNNGMVISKLWKEGKLKTKNSTILCRAAAEGNQNITCLILENLRNFKTEYKQMIDAKVDNSFNLEMTALHIAAENGHHHIVRILLQHKASIDERTADGWTPLLLAAKAGQDDVVQNLINNGASVNQKNSSNSTPLHWAAEGGHTKIFETFIRNGAILDCNDDENWTPLHLAVLFNRKDVIEYFIKTNNKNLPNYENLKHFSFIGDLDRVKEIVQSDVSLVNQVISGRTAIFWAIIGRQFTVTEFLLENHADVNICDEFNATPLHWAAFTNVKIVKLLLPHVSGKVDQMCDKWEMTPLHYAGRDLNKTEIIMQELMQRTKNINCMDNKGWTPLQFAAKNGLVPVVGVLLRHPQINVNIQDNIGNTPLHWSARFGHRTTVQLLLNRNASSALQNNDHKTAMDLAKKYNFLEVVNIL